MAKLVLHLGSNLGNRRLNIDRAISLIKKEVGLLLRQSSIYETAAWGVENQPDFLNVALLIQSLLLPDEALERILLIEAEIGRVRKQRWGARIIDIDILFYNDWCIDYPDLTIPHPRIHERNFVLYPLSEIIPDFIHPLLGKTIQQLKKSTGDELALKKIG